MTEEAVPVALTIAGSDPTGGAGVQGDLRTFHDLGVMGVSVVTAVTAQTTRGVEASSGVAPTLVDAQLRALLRDVRPRAIKTGMLHSASTVAVVAGALRDSETDAPLVVDPVTRSSSGHALLDDAGTEALWSEVVPCATLVTPNLGEASAALGWAVGDLAGMRRGARELQERVGTAVLVKGGHLGGAPVDVLCVDGRLTELGGARVAGASVHGTGCALAASIAAGLACGADLEAATRAAKEAVARRIAAAFAMGDGARILGPRPAAVSSPRGPRGEAL